LGKRLRGAETPRPAQGGWLNAEFHLVVELFLLSLVANVRAYHALIQSDVRSKIAACPAISASEIPLPIPEVPDDIYGSPSPPVPDRVRNRLVQRNGQAYVRGMLPCRYIEPIGQKHLMRADYAPGNSTDAETSFPNSALRSRTRCGLMA